MTDVSDDDPPAAPATPAAVRNQTLIGLGVIGIGVMLAVGALGISSVAGYAGVGPNFLPWVAACVLLLCGGLLVWHARSGGWRSLGAPSGSLTGDWPALAWVAGGILANAALITTIGFVLSCALCFVLAVRGMRLAEGKGGFSVLRLLADVGIGLAIALPVYWLFAKGLSINLPSLTNTGWI
jgi:putative tricarboxylic transport membrane protein